MKILQDIVPTDKEPRDANTGGYGCGCKYQCKISERRSGF